MSKIKVGCIGAGNHATWTLYPTLQYIPDVKIAAICDLDETRRTAAASRFGIQKIYEDFEKMITDEELDAVICCGGAKLHAMVTEKCIVAGIPLFSEKPPAPTAEETKRLAEFADKEKATVMVAFMHRFAIVSGWAKKAISTAQFGKMMMLYARQGVWATKAENVVLDCGIHHIDLLCELGGKVDWLIATKNSDGDRRHAFAVILHFENGVVGQMNLNSLESMSTPGDIIEIHGDKGNWLRIDNWTRVAWYKDTGVLFGAPEDPGESHLVYEHSWTAAGRNRSPVVQGYVGEFVHFFNCLRERIKPKPDLWDGYNAMQIVEAINKSVQTGEKVFIGG